jgi:proteasome lid subunit RPN8/RPN11
MDPEDQLKAFYWLEEHGLDLLAIFHSHPSGPSHPSATDLAEFAYPGVLYLIWSPGIHGPDWQLHAFRLEGRTYTIIDIAPDLSNPSI